MSHTIEGLDKVIAFPQGFSFAKYYEHEISMLKPALEKAGFTGIHFSMGECDSWGPLSRLVHCYDGEKKYRTFVYG